MPYPLTLTVSTRTCLYLSLLYLLLSLCFEDQINIAVTIFISSSPSLFTYSSPSPSWPPVLHPPSLSPSHPIPPPTLSGVEGVALQTEGVNFEAIWAMSSKLVQANQIKCNDIWRMLNTFGIESARASIVTEVQGRLPLFMLFRNSYLYGTLLPQLNSTLPRLTLYLPFPLFYNLYLPLPHYLKPPPLSL